MFGVCAVHYLDTLKISRHPAISSPMQRLYMLHWVFSPNARTFLKFVIYTPTNGSDLLLTITRSCLCWRYKSHPLKERMWLVPPTQGVPVCGWQQVANSHDLVITIIMNIMLDVQVIFSQREDVTCTSSIGSSWWWLAASCPEIYTQTTVHLTF
jgi:hypothetical protein